MVDQNLDPHNRKNIAGLLSPGTVVDSVKYPGEKSIVVQENPIKGEKQLIDEHVVREWEEVTVKRPVDKRVQLFKVPTERHIQTHIPVVNVHEVIKTIHEPQQKIIHQEAEIPHKHYIDKYEPINIPCGTTIKYVPTVNVVERKIEVPVTQHKWVEKIVEKPHICELVRYNQSDSGVEEVILYVPENDDKNYEEIFSYNAPENTENERKDNGRRENENLEPHMSHMNYTNNVNQADLPEDQKSLSSNENNRGSQSSPGSPKMVNLSQTNANGQISSPPSSPRLQTIEQLFIPRLKNTVEIKSEVPIKVKVPVPFMVPKPVMVPVEVPVLRFHDHLVPVPIRRHVIPKITFTDEVYEVECTREKPVLVIEDYFKPVAIDAKIKLKEKDIKINPVDPSELSQADFHAMWMRVNADLYDSYKMNIVSHEEAQTNFYNQFDQYPSNDRNTEFTQMRNELASGDASVEYGSDINNQQQLQEYGKGELTNGVHQDQQISVDGVSQFNESVDQMNAMFDIGQLPLHPGHPLMMTYLQNQWMHVPTTYLHNLYTPEFFRMHSSALDSILHPHPHQINLTEEQSTKLGPLPAEQIPIPWIQFQDKTHSAKAENQSHVTVTEVDISNQNRNFAGPWISNNNPDANVYCSPCCE